MTLFHAVVAIDHHTAQILQFDENNVHPQKVKAHSHHTKQHGSSVRTEHEFFGEVCDALAGISEVLVTGPGTGISDFENYTKKHRPETAKLVVAYETTDHPTDAQLVAMARKYFLKHDRMAGTPTPS